MYTLPLDSRVIGKRLGKTIYSDDGKVLLQKGTVITAGYLSALLRRGYKRIYIENEIVPDIEPSDVIHEETRIKAAQCINRTLTSIAQGKRTDLAQVMSVVDEILEELDDSSEMVFGLSTLRGVDDYTFMHCVNVSILALILGAGLKLDKKRLKNLGVGAILHDVGKTKVERSILLKPSRLSPDEFALVKLHTVYGYDILNNHFGMPMESSCVALQHHERYNGGGYPEGMVGEAIHLNGRITAVADVYDAMTSDRVYRAAMLPHKAIEFIRDGAGEEFDPKVIKVLLERIAPYPAGTLVRLSTGQVGVVIKQVSRQPLYPLVRVVTDDKLELVEPYDVTTEPSSGVSIEAVMDRYPEKVELQIQARNLRGSLAKGG